MSIEENKTMIREYYESFGDISRAHQIQEAKDRNAEAERVVRSIFAKYISPDCIFHSNEGDRSMEEEIKQAAMFFAAFPDFKVIIDEMVAEGDRVVTLFTLQGTHKGTIFGVAPTFKEVIGKAVTIKRLKDGKLVEEWSLIDILPLMRQLGAIAI